MREFKIENYLVKRVEEMGGRALKFTSSNNRGVPDRLCLFPEGVFLFVELKSTGKKLDPLQKIWFEILGNLKQPRVMVDRMAQVDAVIRWAKNQISDRCETFHTPQEDGDGQANATDRSTG